MRAAQQNRGRLLRNRQQSESAPSFNAPNIVVAEADDAPCFQTIDFKRRRAVYKSLYAPFEAATRVRRSTLLDPMMRTSFLSTSTRWASARR